MRTLPIPARRGPVRVPALPSLTVAPLDAARTTALWLDRLAPITPRASLAGDLDVDVVIVGGGFSGLWTAYYLSALDPALRIAVLEREFCGFGASGRNGGWAVGELAAPFESYARRSSPAEALRMARAAFAAVDEVGRVSDDEGIDCHFAKGGTIRVARNGPQAQRQRAEVAHMHSLGFTDDERRLLDADEARAHLAACAANDRQPVTRVSGIASQVLRWRSGG